MTQTIEVRFRIAPGYENSTLRVWLSISEGVPQVTNLDPGMREFRIMVPYNSLCRVRVDELSEEGKVFEEYRMAFMATEMKPAPSNSKIEVVGVKLHHS